MQRQRQKQRCSPAMGTKLTKVLGKFFWRMSRVLLKFFAYPEELPSCQASTCSSVHIRLLPTKTISSVNFCLSEDWTSKGTFIWTNYPIIGLNVCFRISQIVAEMRILFSKIFLLPPLWRCRHECMRHYARLLWSPELSWMIMITYISNNTI